MREALEQDLRAVLNGALNMLGTVERMLPVASDIHLNERKERLDEIKAIDREVDAQEAQIEAECLRIIALHQPVAREGRMGERALVASAGRGRRSGGGGRGLRGGRRDGVGPQELEGVPVVQCVAGARGSPLGAHVPEARSQQGAGGRAVGGLAPGREAHQV